MAKRICSAFLFLVLLAGAEIGCAQVPELIKNEAFRKDAQAAVDSLYNFNPDGADQALAQWKKKYPAHPLWKLMEGMEFWWILLSDLHDQSRDDHFYRLMREADYAASKLLYEQPGHADALIIRTVANGYIARQHSNRDEWISSLNAARKAYNSYGYLQEKMPDFPDLKLAEGLKLYYSEYLPEAYPVVKTVSWFLPDGNKKQGLAELRKASQSAIFARAEASYFLGNINYNYENEYDVAARHFEHLYHTYPHNNYYARLLVKNYYKMGRYEDAMAVINESLKRWDNNSFPFGKVLREELLFWKGRIFYRKQSYGEARSYFEESLQLSKQLPRSSHRSFYPASAYYLGVIMQQDNNQEQARRYYKTAMDAKADSEYKSMARSKVRAMGS